MEKSKFVKYHVPCPECDSSDAASINEDGSLKCFSCGIFIPNKKDKVIRGIAKILYIFKLIFDLFLIHTIKDNIFYF